MSVHQISTPFFVGEYEVCAIPTGIFGLDGGAMFGTVPKVLWEKAIPADEKNRIPMEARALLLKSKTCNILIDCGNGSHFIEKYGEKIGKKFADMYSIDEHGPSLLKSLARFGVSADQITDVILTHLHFDHCGGGVSAENGKLVPTFKNARYYIQKRNLETARHSNVRERASYFSANFEPLIEHNVLTILDGAQDNLLPGISVVISDGHTQGQQLVRVHGNDKDLLYCADLIPTSAHVRLAWVMGYDLEPLKVIAEKENVLKTCVAKNSGDVVGVATGIASGAHITYLYFEHDPACSMATVEAHGHDFVVKERFNLTHEA